MKMHVLIYVLFLAGVFRLDGQVGDTLKYRSLEPYDFHLQYLKDDSAMLIDVREPFEYRGKIIKGAINIPSSGNMEFASDTISRNLSLFMYCTTDFRSKRVAQYFGKRGFRKVYSLEGGIVAWKKEGFPVVKGTKRRKR